MQNLTQIYLDCIATSEICCADHRRNIAVSMTAATNSCVQ